MSGVLGDSVNKNSSVAAGVSEEYANQALTLLIPSDETTEIHTLKIYITLYTRHTHMTDKHIILGTQERVL